MKPSLHDHAVILCSGPSLVLFDPKQYAEAAIIAVNHAYVRLYELGLPEPYYLMCFDQGSAIRQLLERGCEVDPTRVMLWFVDKELRARAKTELPCKFNSSSTFAAWAALNLMEAKRIDVFGVDLAGSTDWDGRMTRHRSERRWEAEAEMWNQMAWQCDGKGVELNIHCLPDDGDGPPRPDPWELTRKVRRRIRRGQVRFRPDGVGSGAPGPVDLKADGARGG